MLGWIFRKKDNATGPAPAAAAKHKAPKTAAAPAQAAAPAPAAPAPAVDWAARLTQARGDDEALLALLRSADTPLPFKQAAVEALDGEAALKLAERECRKHDRRVHQLAKRRLLAKGAQRQAREQAAQLIDTLRSLAAQADVPVNRGVELDHAWQALDADAIEPAQRETYALLTAQLAAQVRQRADFEAQRKRWQAEARQALQQLQATAREAAAGTQDRAALAQAADAARRVLGAAPTALGVDAAAPDTAALQQALALAAALDSHLAVLDLLHAGPAARAQPTATAAAPAATGETAAEAAPAATGEAPGGAVADAADAADEAPGDTAAGDPSTTAAADPQAVWLALPPLPDAALAALLQARHARWQQARDQARQERQSRQREQARERQRTRQGTQGAALADSVAQAEAALDAGQLADAHRHLSDIDAALHGAEAPEALHTRLAAAQARLAQLRGWQHWAGGRARDELVLQAEALAAATVATGEGGSAAEAEVARLSIRQRAEVITTLRERWKEIDRAGGAGGRALWLRFDAALKTADEPVAAHLAAQRAAREANLAARLQLLDRLDAVVLAAPTRAEAAADAPSPAAHEPPADAHALAGALQGFHVEWRKLGPLEHTVPRPARAGLAARLEAAVQRLEAPLQAARQQARAERAALVVRARALAEHGPGRDLVHEVRALQAEWQQHAKALPLARADEQALWTDFKAATDAAFAARAALYNARDAELEAHAAERAALIERLQVQAEDTPAAQRRTLAEVEAAWQRCGPAPRGRAAALDAAYRNARDALRQWLDQAAQRAWLARCEALDAKRALGLAREAGAADAEATTAAWQALPALPGPLEAALRRRAGLDAARPDDAQPDTDELLLQIETAWDLPTPPAHEAARRERKLLAMKAALEGRRASSPETLPPEAALARLLARPEAGTDTGQRERLAAVLAAWRRRGPQNAA